MPHLARFLARAEWGESGPPRAQVTALQRRGLQAGASAAPRLWGQGGPGRGFSFEPCWRHPGPHLVMGFTRMTSLGTYKRPIHGVSFFRPPPRREDFTEGKKAPHTACMPRGQSLLRTPQPPSSHCLPTFRDWGTIVTMMFPACSLPVRRVTYRILLCPLDNPGRNGLLLSSHFMDEETEAGKVKLPHS